MKKKESLTYSIDTQLRVRYGETDQMGYCYYGNYGQYFEVGRVEAMRQIGMSYKEMEKGGFMLPVIDFRVQYFLPAFYDDLLTITTFVSPPNGIRLQFDYEIKNEQRKIITKGYTTHVFVNQSTMKPTQPPTTFVQLLQSKKIKP